LAATAYFATFLVLRPPLKASLPHVSIDLRAASLGAGAHQVDRRFFAAFEWANYFVNDAVV